MANDVLIQKEQAGKMAQQNGQGYSLIKDYFEKHKDQLYKTLPKNIDREFYFNTQLLYISQNKELHKCTKESLFVAICQGAEFGLSFSPVLQQAYCIPYGNVATFMVGYRGQIDKILSAGKYKNIDAHVVYEKDAFDFGYGSQPFLTHRPSLETDKGKRMCVYAIVWSLDGSFQFIILNNDELEAIKNKSKAKNSMAYNDFPDELARKAAVRRLFKYLKVTPEAQPMIDKLFRYDDENNGLIKEKDVSEKPESKTLDLLSRIKSPQPEPEDAAFEDISDTTEKDSDGLFK